MADSNSGALAFLRQKAGPLPVWAWLAGFAVIWWYYQRQNSAGSAANAASSTTGTGYGTDPAGNTGYIDPETGYVYGSAEDIAALQSENELASNTDASSSGSGTGTYTDDNAWAEAAINYLVARGVDPTTANQAITLYLSGQNLTTEQQADVNLAIQGIGAPPQLPGPSTGNPTPVQGTTVTVPNVVGMTAANAATAIRAAGLVFGTGGVAASETVTAQSPAAGTTVSSGTTVTITAKAASSTSTGTTTGTSGSKTAAKAPAMPGGIHGTPYTNRIDLAWTAVPTATQYRIRATYQSAVVYNGTSSTNHATVTGLAPNRTYTIHVAAGNSAGWSSETNGPAIKTTQ
jgi:hypothetical protein